MPEAPGAQTPPDLEPIDLSAGPMNVQSRTRSDSTAQPLAQVGLGPVPEGFELNVGSSNGATNRLYVILMTSAAGNARVELEAKLGNLEVGGNVY